MKKAYLPAAVVILIAAGFLGLFFGLSPLVEGQVQRGIQSIGISGDGISTQAAVDRVEFSPLSRTLTLYGLRLRLVCRPYLTSQHWHCQSWTRCFLPTWH